MIIPVNHKVFGYYFTSSDIRNLELLMPEKIRSYFQLGYRMERRSIVNPFNMSVAYESGRMFQKASMEFNYRYSYYGINNGLEIRVFAGTMLKNTSPDPYYSFSSGGRSGREQYLFQGLYPDRFTEFPKTFWSRQMTLSEGGLVTPVNDSLGYSRWLCSFTLTSSLPGIASGIPVKPFINLVLNDLENGTKYKSPLFFEAGLKAGIWNFFEIYVPFLVSDNIDAISGSIKDRIRFVFKLDLVNPLRLK
jgi:hypothetical protein